LTAVAQTAPGVLMNTSNGGGYGNFTAFGLPATANLFTVNGNDENDPYLNLNNSGATNLLLGTNEVQEVGVVSNGYTGQYGRQAGAQVDYVTKTGTNAFHGNAVYFYNNKVMNANDWFNNASSTPLPGENNNQWQASVGGPIKKDKIFFFADYEGLRYVLGTSNLTIVPTPQFAAAVVQNLPSFGMNNSAAYYSNMFHLFDTAPGINRAVPVGNAIDGTGNLGCGDLNTTGGSGAVVPGFAQFGGLSGTTNGSYGTNLGGGTPCSENFRSTVGALSREWILAANGEVILNDSNRVNIRYRADRGLQPTYTDSINPAFTMTSNQPQNEGQINWNHVFSPTKTNQLILSGMWYSAIFGPQSIGAQSVYPGTLENFDTSAWANMGGIDYDFPQGRNVSQVQVVDDFTWSKGNHTFRFGGNYRYNKVSDYSNQVLNVPLLLIFSTTDFVEGVNDYIRQRHPNLLRTSVGISSLGLYAQDEWKVNSGLKLTLALRVDRNTNTTCYQNCFSRLVTSFPQLNHDRTIPYSQMFANNLGQAFPDIQPINFEPRVGFAWTPKTKWTSKGNTVIRGGAGLFTDLYPATLADRYMHNSLSLNDYTIQFAGAPLSTGEAGNGYESQNTCDTIFRSVAGSASGTLANYNAQAAAAGLPCATPNYQSTINKIYNPEFVEWNLQVQQAITSTLMADFNYVGNHGYDMFIGNPWVNAAKGATNFAPLPVARPDARVRSVNNLTNSAISNYNGLSMSLTQRTKHGFSFRFNYTYSHTSDDSSNGGLLPYSLNDSQLVQLFPTDMHLNYSNADYDVRHYISANYIWEMPFKFSNKALNTVAGGWMIAGTFFHRTGLPFSATDGNMVGRLSGSSLAAFLAVPTGAVSNATCGKSAATGTACLDANQFVGTGAATTFSTIPRNFFRGPGYFNSDFSILKTFTLTERVRFAIGGNFYNVFNHPNFANPISDVSSGQFGTIQSTVVPPTSPYGAFVGSAVSGREVQVTGRISF
jgi:hypothetical protein